MPLKLIAIGVALLALTGLLWHDHAQTAKANRLARETNQLRADYAALEAAHAHERQIATEASRDYENRLQALSVSAADTPVRSVRLCRSPTGYVPATASAASGVNAAGSAGHEGEAGQDPRDGRLPRDYDRFSEDGPDAGPALYALADAKDKQLAQCASLIKWVEIR